MLPIRFENITATDVLRLIEMKTGERKTLEYKERLAVGGREERTEFLSDISSFANASGGDILFGVSEERDAAGKSTGIPGQIKPLQIDSEAVECARIEDMIKDGIQPRIPLVQIKVIQIPETGPIIIIVRIGKSWISPHMVTFSNFSRFFSRNSSTGKVQLDVQQIGSAFALQRELGERLRDWKANRIAKATAEEGPIPLRGAKLLFHFVPAITLLNEKPALPRTFEPNTWGQGSSLMSFGKHNQRYNADGFLLTSEIHEGKESYLQVFREGALEYGDSYAFGSSEKQYIASARLEEKIARTYDTALLLLKYLQVPSPIFATITLIGVKGRTMVLPQNVVWVSYYSEPFDRDVILCPDVMLEGSPNASILLPVVNSIWQAAGLKETPYLHNNGAWQFANP